MNVDLPEENVPNDRDEWPPWHQCRERLGAGQQADTIGDFIELSEAFHDLQENVVLLIEVSL